MASLKQETLAPFEPLSEAKERLGRLSLIAGPPSHVFISFSHHDRVHALEILDRLEASGLKCWIACRDVPLGGDFQDAIVDALEEASAMVLVFSKNADNSREIKKELALASEFGLLVVPLRIEDAEPTKGLKYQLVTRQYIDLFDDRERRLAAVINFLRNRMHGNKLACPSSASARDNQDSAGATRH